MAKFVEFNLPLLGLKEDAVRPIQSPVQQGLRGRDPRLGRGGGTAGRRLLQKGLICSKFKYIDSEKF